MHFANEFWLFFDNYAEKFYNILLHNYKKIPKKRLNLFALMRVIM